VFVNADEALRLTGRARLGDAANVLAEWADVAVVTRGADGALACTSDSLVEVPGVSVDVVDTTGAGDLFAAAWVWGEANGLDIEDRLRWAVLYASLSVRVPTGAAGAVTVDVLLAEGARRGLPAPATTVVPARGS
jgi:ribokinase